MNALPAGPANIPLAARVLQIRTRIYRSVYSTHSCPKETQFVTYYLQQLGILHEKNGVKILSKPSAEEISWKDWYDTW